MKRVSQLPRAIDVAIDHAIWLWKKEPLMTPQEAGEMYGLKVYTWEEFIRGLARTWSKLPKRVRRQADHHRE